MEVRFQTLALLRNLQQVTTRLQVVSTIDKNCKRGLGNIHLFIVFYKVGKHHIKSVCRFFKYSTYPHNMSPVKVDLGSHFVHRRPSAIKLKCLQIRGNMHFCYRKVTLDLIVQRHDLFAWGNGRGLSLSEFKFSQLQRGCNWSPMWIQTYDLSPVL